MLEAFAEIDRPERSAGQSCFSGLIMGSVDIVELEKWLNRDEENNEISLKSAKDLLRSPKRRSIVEGGAVGAHAGDEEALEAGRQVRRLSVEERWALRHAADNRKHAAWRRKQVEKRAIAHAAYDSWRARQMSYGRVYPAEEGVVGLELRGVAKPHPLWNGQWEVPVEPPRSRPLPQLCFANRRVGYWQTDDPGPFDRTKTPPLGAWRSSRQSLRAPSRLFTPSTSALPMWFNTVSPRQITTASGNMRFDTRFPQVPTPPPSRGGGRVQTAREVAFSSDFFGPAIPNAPMATPAGAT